MPTRNVVLSDSQHALVERLVQSGLHRLPPQDTSSKYPQKLIVQSRTFLPKPMP